MLQHRRARTAHPEPCRDKPPRRVVTLAANLLLSFLRLAEAAAKSTAFPTLHRWQKNIGLLFSLLPLGKKT